MESRQLRRQSVQRHRLVLVLELFVLDFLVLVFLFFMCSFCFYSRFCLKIQRPLYFTSSWSYFSVVWISLLFLFIWFLWFVRLFQFLSFWFHSFFHTFVAFFLVAFLVDSTLMMIVKRVFTQLAALTGKFHAPMTHWAHAIVCLIKPWN